MGAVWRARGAGLAAALLAVLLLGFATVRSTVMQVEMASASAMADCGMDMGGASKAAKPGKAPAGCPFCAAAACPPVGPAVVALPVSGAVDWVRWTPFAPRGARAPPPVAARARGPPAPSLTA